jgi:putative ABC transport system substrate-binding protein
MKTRRSQLVLLAVSLVIFVAGACSGAPAPSPTARPIPKVGLMHVGTDHIPPSLGTLVAGLAGYGWVTGSQDELVADLTADGRITSPKIELLWRNLQPDQAVEQAAEYVRQRVDVIVAFEDKSIKAAQDATAQMEHPIPVVFLHPSDPVRDGLVVSLSHPGGNLTGVFGARDPVVQQLQLYRQIMPRLKRLLTLVDPTDLATPVLLDKAKQAAAQLGIDLVIREASTQADLEREFGSVKPGDVDGAFLLSPSLRLTLSSITIQLATAAHLPVQAHRKEWVEQGALFSIGVDVGPVGTRGARFVDSILNGTAPADLPVEEVNKNEVAINLRVAAALGIDVPQAVIDGADRIYR